LTRCSGRPYFYGIPFPVLIFAFFHTRCRGNNKSAAFCRVWVCSADSPI